MTGDQYGFGFGLAMELTNEMSDEAASDLLLNSANPHGRLAIGYLYSNFLRHRSHFV
jgi:hypothetical protein